MKKATVRYISASERLNYGDLLFPIIFKNYFNNFINFHNYGLIESDYVDFGAIKTKSYKSLLKEINIIEDYFVVGGGEFYFSNWSKLYSFINPTYNFLSNFRVFNKIDSYLNLISKFLGDGKSHFPYFPEFTTNIIYIAGGGQFPKNNKYNSYLKCVLLNSKIVSVRDNRTYRSMLDHDIKADLIPDSAILMSKLFSPEFLETKTDGKFHINRGSYVYLQVGKNKGPINLQSFVNQLEKVSTEFGLKVICSPIGFAPGHEDDKILKKLVSLSKDWELVYPNNIYDIMYLISNSKMYIGTSLHGAITAFAYQVPIMPLNKKILKLNSFVNTWTKEVYISNIDFEMVYESFFKVFDKWDEKVAENLLKNQQEIVEAYFEKINKIFLNQ